MFNLLEFVGGLGLVLLIVFAVTQVIVPEFFGWPKFWLFDSKKRAKIEGHEAPPQPPSQPANNNSGQKSQPKLTNGPKR